MNDGEQSDWRRLLTPAERARMLGDIARVSLTVGSHLFPEQPWQDLDVSAGSLAARQSPAERLGFIERLLPLLAQAMTQIGRDPLTAPLSHTRPTAPPIRARRVTSAALLEAARRGPSARSLEETVTILSFDTPENRAVQAFLGILARDSAAITQIAEAEEETEAAERAERCRQGLRGLLALPWWEEGASDGTAWTKPPSSRAIQRPEYAAVFREMGRYRAGFAFDWGHPLLTLPPRETWRLYETWCLFAALEALSALGFQPVAGAHQNGLRLREEAPPPQVWGAGRGQTASDSPALAPQTWGGGASPHCYDTPHITGADMETPDLFTVWEGRLTFTPATGSASRVTFRSPAGPRLSLTYNQTFAEGRHSLSHTMRPDITLASDTRLWILDAKFKPYALPGEEGDDINQMHAYRDAIVDSSGRRNVARAWCLYAGQADAPNRAKITYGRAEEAAVGALCLRPGDENTLTNLRALLSDWLTEAPPTPAPPAFPQI